MILPKLVVAFLGLTVVECVQYGHNHVLVRRDSEAVAANFADVPGYDLIAPAFQDPSSVSARFANGTEGPTDDYVLGRLPLPITILSHLPMFKSAMSGLISACRLLHPINCLPK